MKIENNMTIYNYIQNFKVWLAMEGLGSFYLSENLATITEAVHTRNSYIQFKG